MFYKNPTTLIPSTSKSKVIFACDPNYWNLYSKYLAKSCDVHGINVHVHIMGDDSQCLEDAKEFLTNLDNNHSLSYEPIDSSVLEIPKFSYYFIARYYVARDLFNNTELEEAIILDADVILEKPFDFPENKDIGIFYRPAEERPFRQVWGNLFMIKKSKSWYLDKLIAQYESNYNSIDWAWVHTLKGKKRVQHYSGQDQISIAETINYVKDDPGFFNLKSLKIFGPNIWSLTGDGQKSNPETYEILKSRFGF